MKVIGVAGSPRADKSSKFFLQKCLETAQENVRQQGGKLDIEYIDISGLQFGGCISCGACQKELRCSLDDDFAPLLETLSDTNLAGLVLSSPVYMGTMTAQMKAFVDRTVPLRRNGFLLRDKIGAALAVGGSRNGGQELTLQGIHAAMMIHDMMIVGNGTHFGGMAWGNHPDGYENDDLGVRTAVQLGERIARVIVQSNK